MRNAWRSLAARTLSHRISPQIPRSLQLIPSQLPNPRFFSDQTTLLTSLLSKPLPHDQIRSELDSLNPEIDYEAVISVLGKLDNSPEIAAAFFDWVLKKEAGLVKNRLVTSKACNLVIGIVATKGKADALWELVETTGKCRYKLTEENFSKVSERFKRERMENELSLVKAMYSRSSARDLSWKICKVLREEEDLKAVRRALNEIGDVISADVATAVFDRINMYPKKAMLFFNWLEKNATLEIDDKMYTSVVKTLAVEDCIDSFWSALKKMRSSGFGLEIEAYFLILNRFLKQKMVSAAVDLYEFMMAGTNKPPVTDFLLLLKKVVVSKELDTDLVTKVVKLFTDAGNTAKAEDFNSTVRALASVDRLAECGKILKAMEEGGFKSDDKVHDLVVVSLSRIGKLDEALQYLVGLGKSGGDLYLRGWRSVIHEHSLAGKFDKAISSFHMMVEKKGGKNVGSAFELLVTDLCMKKSALYAYKVFKDSVANKNVLPWHSTYKILIKQLIGKREIKEASELLGLMKTHGFPPFIDPFIDYVAKSGTVDDASIFLKAMTTKDFPSREVYLRMFKALFQANRHGLAHDVLSIAPGSVRNHEDVLNLFYKMKKDEEAAIASA